MQCFVPSAVGVAALAAFAGFAQPAVAQTPATPAATCSQVVAWSACDMTFDLSGRENTPQGTLQAEFRSPHYKTILIHAFHEGSHLVLRFAPTEAGTWNYRL